MNLAVTEEVNIFQSESNFAVAIQCDNNKNEKLTGNDLLELKSSYILYANIAMELIKNIQKNLKLINAVMKTFIINIISKWII